MALFLAIPLRAENDFLDRAVIENIEEQNRFRLQANAGWIIEFDGTSTELSDKIGITGQEAGVPSPVGSALVTNLTNYYGRGPANMWEWIRVRLES